MYHVIQIKDSNLNDERYIYCGRGNKYLSESPLHNPYPIRGKDTRDVVCDRYEKLFNTKIKENDPTFMDELERIKGIHDKHGEVYLVCYCAPKRCHCDTVKEYLDKQESLPNSTKRDFRLIVAGGRDFRDYKTLSMELDKSRAKLEAAGRKIVVVSGLARGADKLGLEWAIDNDVEVMEYPADWDKYGKSAGYRRNTVMAQNADGLLAFWNKSSKGTAHMIKTMKALGKPVKVVRYSNPK